MASSFPQGWNLATLAMNWHQTFLDQPPVGGGTAARAPPCHQETAERFRSNYISRQSAERKGAVPAARTIKLSHGELPRAFFPARPDQASGAGCPQDSAPGTTQRAGPPCCTRLYCCAAAGNTGLGSYYFERYLWSSETTLILVILGAGMGTQFPRSCNVLSFIP